MKVLLHDGTVDGLLTAVAEASAADGESVQVRAAEGWEPSLFETPVAVAADPGRAGRLVDALRSRGSARIVRRALYTAMSEQPDAGTALVGYVRRVRVLGAGFEDHLADPHVARVREIAREVGREVHRLKGLLRFRRLRDGRLWSPVSPDANVLSALAVYFRDRMPAETWVLHDVRRRLAIRWDGKELAWVAPEDLPSEKPELTDEEEAYQGLWQRYFRTIAVPERRNPRLQRQYMPVRYWKHLVESPGSASRKRGRPAAPKPHRKGGEP